LGCCGKTLGTDSGIKRLDLHAKSIIYDNTSVYIGTLNLDPRSEGLNTEIGVLVDNPALCESIRGAFLNDLAEGQFWQVNHDKDMHLNWVCGSDSTTIQPAKNSWQRMANFIYARLPIQQQL